MLTFINCGHCGEYVSPQPCRHGSSEAVWRPNEADNSQELWRIARCPRCMEPMLYLDGGPPTAFPPAMPPKLSDHVPPNIREEAHEAQRCLVNRCWRAAALMARRALEGACDEKGANNGMLGEKLGWLRKQELITARLAEQASALQIVGNAAAHGGPPISQEDAETTIAVMKRVLESLYEDDRIAADLKAKHAKKK